MRVYLVIMDETEEAAVALRFAARRAAKTGGAVQLLALIPPQPFVAFGGIQATIEEEARSRAEVLAADNVHIVIAEGAPAPQVTVEIGEAIRVVPAYLDAHPEVAALVLGAPADGSPGPLIAHFAGSGVGKLPCPLFIVPGGLDEAAIDRLS
jgi:hypothetical protein